LITLRQEFISAVFGRLVNRNIKFIAQAQKQYFARENEILDQNPGGSPKEYGLRTFTPPSLTVATCHYKMFRYFHLVELSNFFLTLTMDPHWSDYEALMRGDGVFIDSAIAAIIFMIKPSAVMNFIQKHQTLGTVSAFVWRIECQKRSSTYSYPLLD
jgi:hypothetical protein